ncbi:glycosyl transferase family 9 [Chloroherpeton thalassium ATCC 35110]|uniref:Glycosyl transferase family 9 n=1 Tax=Chloroherpeton thalassium (strain ATCC 35110 / GB-78) TaxID=517418 RepID=B3QTM2_CHLT3|nr:glycosyltransferase family 9 protein [Chloroherpeton thalassium]ACF12768.1 glycosyl transferase family 9 [Chloroherpeton thalassium ATCC 35110]
MIQKATKRRLLARLMRLFWGRLLEKPAFQGNLNRIVILAQEKLGDAILLTPLIKQLRQANPKLEIHLVAVRAAADFFQHDKNIDVLHRPKSGLMNFIFSVRKFEFDVLFNTKDHPSWTFMMYSILIPARYKIAVFHDYHRGFYHHLLDVPFESHVVRKNCAVLPYLKIPASDEACRPYLPDAPISEEIQQFAESFVGKKVIGINLSAGEPSREWPLEKWSQLLALLPLPTIIFSMPDRFSEKESLEKAHPHVLKTPRTKSLFDAAVLIKKLSLLITPDTSFIHVASCSQTPVVGLYRADVIHHTRFAPYQLPNIQVISKTSLVHDISVVDVQTAAEKMLQVDLRKGFSA